MKKYLLATSLIIFIFLALLLAFYYETHRKISIDNPVPVQIKKGESIKSISLKLEKKGIIPNSYIFILYSLLKGKNLKYGFYEFRGEVSVENVWKILSEGKEKLIQFTIIPGEDLIDIGKKLEKTGLVKKKEFYDYVFNPQKVKEKGLQGISFEGYFPPETYFFRKESSIDEIVNGFLNIFKKRYRPFLKQIEGFTPYQVMIIASLVEKETSVPEEKSVIAGVIINRLKRKMKLQIDPTVIYALKLSGNWNGNLTKKNMKINSPYNTYLHYGLPPTPICSFSIESLKAVLNYHKTDFLYYFSPDKKSHSFSKTYKEHLKKIKKAY